MKKILFVQPSPPRNSIYPLSLPPLGLLTLASLTDKNKYDIEFIDANIQNLPLDKSYDLVCISVMTACKKNGYYIAGRYKKKGAIVIIGGPHTTLCPNDVAEHCDTIVQGQAEFIWEKILLDYEKGSLKRKYVTKKTGFRHVTLDWSLIKAHYLFYNQVLTTRGCPNRCSYCQISGLFGNKVTHKPVKKVIDEIKNFKKKGYFSNWVLFCDDNLTSDKKYAIKLFKELSLLNKRLIIPCSINFARDDELLFWAYKAGVRIIMVGFETLNQKTLNSVSKQVKSDDYPSLIMKLNQKGIKILGSFIVGLEGDNLNDVKNSLKFAMDNTVFAEFCVLKILPKTRMAYSKGFSDICDAISVDSTKQIKNVPRLVHYCHEHYYSIKQILSRTMGIFSLKKNYKYTFFYFIYSMYLYLKVRFKNI